ncbi:MAG TPA: hypothetical protein VF209_04345 [Patescibacteria group bacterium]
MKRFILAYFFFCFFFFVFFASGFIDSQDGFQYVAIARRIYYDQTFEMPPGHYPETNLHLSITKNARGQAFSPTGLGYSLALLPAVALEDAFLHLSQTEPIAFFPLENDWPVLLFASMTNAAFGALLAVVLYLYMRDIGLTHLQAILLSLVGLVSSNLWVYTKHVFPQLMFVSFLMLSFYWLRKAVKTRQWLLMIGAGMAYGVVVISYNPTYLFPLPAIGIYYLFLSSARFSLAYIKKIVSDVLLAGIGILPFLVLYTWFNWVRFGGLTATGYGTGGIPLPTIPPAYVLLEGTWGLLFSPGKSIFIYTPLLLVLIIFWFKIKKKVLPEVVAGIILFVTYVYFTATLLGDVDYLVWHGDSSWGPRYLLPVLPLALVVIGHIFTQLSRWQKILIFWPLCVIGIWIELVSILLPYQIRFAGLQTDVFFNQRNFNVYEYGNEIPRYAPWFKMSKTLIKRLRELPQAWKYGPYQLRLIDGFAYPFDLGWTKWREVMPQALITFDHTSRNPVQQLTFQVRNHSLVPESSYSAQLSFVFNDQPLPAATITIPIDQESEAVVVPPANLLSEHNRLVVATEFIGTSSARLEKRQVPFLQIIRINGVPQNISTLTYPYVSSVSQGLGEQEYYYWGQLEQDPWQIWHMHSGVYEQTFDLWWLRPFHYWDLPKDFYFSLLALNLVGLIVSGYYVRAYSASST